MPIYDYKCPKCGEVEIMHSVNKSKKKCDKCGSKIKRIYGFKGLLDLRGDGFYRSGVQE